MNHSSIIVVKAVVMLFTLKVEFLQLEALWFRLQEQEACHINKM